MTSTAVQQTNEPKPMILKDGIMSFLPFILIFVVFYFFMIRPQVKKQKEQVAMIKSIKKGDKVLLSNGIFGKVIKEKDAETLVVEISKDTNIEVIRSAVANIVNG
jgi:preprotein translocase subunit YajC